MAWSGSLKPKFTKIQPKEEKKQDSSFYDDFKARSAVQSSRNIASTPSVKSTSSGNSDRNSGRKSGNNTSSKQEGGSKSVSPSSVIENNTKFFKGYTSYQDRKKNRKVFTPAPVFDNIMPNKQQRKVFTPSTVLSRQTNIKNGFDIPTTKAIKEELDQYNDVSINGVSAETDKALKNLLKQYNDAVKIVSPSDRNAAVSKLLNDNKKLLDEYARTTGYPMNTPSENKIKSVERILQNQRRDNYITQTYNNRMQRYNDTVNRPDFMQYSVENTDLSKDWMSDKVNYTFRNAFDEHGTTKRQGSLPYIPYEEEKPVTDENGNVTTTPARVGEGQVIRAINDEDVKLLYMNTKERQIYNYYLNKYGKKEAYKYLDDLKPVLDERYTKARTAGRKESIENIKTNNKALGIVAGGVDSLINSAFSLNGAAFGDALGQAVEQYTASAENIRPYNPNTTAALPINDKRADIEAMENGMSDTGKAITDFTMSTLENIERLPLGVVGLPAMAASVAGQTAVDKGQQGEVSAGRAAATGGAYGGIEYLTEKLPLENVLNLMQAPPSTVKGWFKQLFKNGLTELGEESISNLADNAADELINGDRSEFAQAVRANQADGMSVQEATQKAFIDKYVIDTLKSGGSGFVSGVALSGLGAGLGTAVNNYNDTVQTGRIINESGKGQEMVDIGIRRDNDTSAYKYAQKMQQKQDRGRDLSDWNVGRQYQKNVKAVDAENILAETRKGFTGVPNEIVGQLDYDSNGRSILQHDNNGRFIPNASRVQISDNRTTSIPETLSHEYAHVLKEFAPEQFKTYEDYVNSVVRLSDMIPYDSNVQREETAAIVAEKLKPTAEQIEKTVSGDYTIADKAIDAIDKVSAKLKDKFGSSQSLRFGGEITNEQLYNARKLWEDVERAAAQNKSEFEGSTDMTDGNADVKYSPNEYDSDGNRFWRIDTQKDIFKNIKRTSDLKKTAYNYLLNGADGMQVSGTIDGQTVVFNRVGAEEYVYGRQSQELDSKYGEQAKRQKMRLAPSIDDLIENASVSWTAPDAKNHKQFDGYFDNYRGRVKIDDTMFTYIVRVGYGKSGEKLFYDVNLEPIETEDVDSRGLRQKPIPHNNKMSTSSVNNSISENEPIVKNSLKENDLRTEECQKRFSENVDKTFSGEMPQRAVITVGDTPELLQRYGASDVPITINQSTMYKIAYPTGYFGAEKQGHNLGIPALKQLPQQIANPVAILKSNSQDGSMILLTEWEDTHGNPVIIPLHLDKDGAIGITNEIVSSYGKQNFNTLLTDKDGNSNVLYTKNNEDIQQLVQSRLQLPGAPADDTLVNYNISNPDGNVKFSLKESTGEEKKSLKEQIRSKSDELNQMQPVIRYEYNIDRGLSNSEKRNAVMNEYLKKYSTDGKDITVTRKGLGDVSVGAKEIRGGLRYLNTDSEYAAVLAVPSVITDGKEVGRHNNHKNRGYNTITFAAPVEINGIRGNMAVTIKETNKYKYKMHRILMPDGSMLEFSDNKKNSSYNDGTADNNVGGSPSIATVPNNSIPNSEKIVKNSLKEDTVNSKRQISEKQKEAFKKLQQERDWDNLMNGDEALRQASENYRNGVTPDSSTDGGVRYLGISFSADAAQMNKLAAKLDENSDKILKNSGIFDIKSGFEFGGKTVSEKINNYFESIGGQAVNPELGTVELTRSGAKSTVFHGMGEDKLTAVAAIKDVIEKGVVIDHQTNWKNRGYDTYIIAGRGNIDGNDSIVGVVVKNYPKSFANNKFYLHEVIKMGDTVISDNSATPVTDRTVEAEVSPSTDIISENEPIVKNSLKENDLRTEECQKRFSENVDKTFSGEMPQRAVITVGDTPELLQRYGASDVPITINQSTMYKIAYPTGYFGAEKQGHNLGIPALKQLPQQIANPVAILKSNSQDGSMILLTEWEDTHGNPVIIPLHLDKQGEVTLENNIASAYGKQNIESLFVDKQANSNILYTKNNEDIHDLIVDRLQLPAAPKDDTLVNYNISNPDGNVKFSLKESTGDTAHTPEQIRIMQEYEAAVDPNLLSFVERAKENPQDNKTIFVLNDVSDRLADDIKSLTQIDVSGFGNSIKNNTITHIENDHGAEGATDRSMADDRDIARIQYVIDNYDNIELLDGKSAEYRDKNQRPAPMVKLSKRIDGTYYLVEAVPDTRKHQLAVVSAYKNKAVEQQTRDVQAPLQVVRNASADTTSIDTVSQDEEDVKSEPGGNIKFKPHGIQGTEGKSSTTVARASTRGGGQSSPLSGRTNGFTPITTTASLPNTVNPNIIQQALMSFSMSKKIEPIKPIKNPLFT